MSKIVQSPPVEVSNGIGWVGETGWSETAVSYFPWVKAQEHNPVKEHDKSASRCSFRTPVEATVAAYALAHGWNINRVDTVMDLVHMYDKEWAEIRLRNVEREERGGR